MNEINKFYQSLIQDIIAFQASNEEGDTQEQIFTRIAIYMLSDAGETENADVAIRVKICSWVSPSSLLAWKAMISCIKDW